MRHLAKKLVERLPRPFGIIIASLPPAVKFGRQFTLTTQWMEWFELASMIDQQAQVLGRVCETANYALENVPYYRSINERLRIGKICTFDDFARLPITTKSELRSCPLSRRSVPVRGRILVNTGGSTGEPLHFYHDASAVAREWAHMYRIWRAAGYSPRALKLTFRGKNLGNKPTRFNAVNNEFYANAYLNDALAIPSIARVCEDNAIRFLHGYPSSIAAFAKKCLSRYPTLLDRLRRTLQGVLLASEFPAPVYRDVIYRAFPVPSVSWYGHSEMAILAVEVSTGRYKPFHTYGFAEAIADPAGQWRLVGTSYGNVASPFLRFDTGDLVIPEWEGPLLKCFQVHSGRVGDFVIDAHGNQISLTALIFGRHHPAFEWADHIQVSQDRPGHITVFVTVTDGTARSEAEVLGSFDFAGTSLRISVQVIPAPLRSATGKTPLLVQSIF